MRDYFVFAGKPSSDFNAFIYDANVFDSVERTVDTYDVPGRNGVLTVTGTEKFTNRKLEYEMYVPELMLSNIPALFGYLYSLSGYHRLEDTLEPDVFKKAMLTNSVELSVKTPNQATFKLSFDCLPEKWLKSGEICVAFTSSGTIHNPTLFYAKPLIRVYGKGTFQIGSDSIEILKAPVSYIDIDADTQDCHEGSDNRNSYVTLAGGYPILPAGDTGIVLGEGIKKVEITPRWWRI